MQTIEARSARTRFEDDVSAAPRVSVNLFKLASGIQGGVRERLKRGRKAELIPTRASREVTGSSRRCKFPTTASCSPRLVNQGQIVGRGTPSTRTPSWPARKSTLSPILGFLPGNRVTSTSSTNWEIFVVSR